MNDMIRYGDIVRDKGSDTPLGVVVGMYYFCGEDQVAIDPTGDSVPMDLLHRRARDVDVEASV